MFIMQSVSTNKSCILICYDVLLFATHTYYITFLCDKGLHSSIFLFQFKHYHNLIIIEDNYPGKLAQSPGKMTRLISKYP